MPRPSWSIVRTVARMASALLPAVALRRLAAYRFGYSQKGRQFSIVQTESAVGIDGRLTLRATPEFMSDLRFHFVDNGQSRDEIGAFMDEPSPTIGALLYDVGAHHGLFSLVHCALGPDRRAVLFDPSPSLAAGARALIALNGFEARAEVRACGVGDRVGRRQIVEDALGFAREVPPGASGSESIPFTTLDEEWRRTGAPPSIVKIDVEGAEAEVIRGAAGLLRDVRPILFLELHLDELERRGESIDLLIGQLTERGYRCFDYHGHPRSVRSLTGSLRAIERIIARPR